MEKSTAPTRRILLIDDNEDLREIYYTTLSAIANLEVLLADSGAAGLVIAQREPLDAILLDVVMPGMGGPEVLHHLHSQAKTQTIPVIFMTARTHAEDRQHLLSIGAKAVISKTSKPQELAMQVIELLNRI